MNQIRKKLRDWGPKIRRWTKKMNQEVINLPEIIDEMLNEGHLEYEITNNIFRAYINANEDDEESLDTQDTLAFRLQKLREKLLK